MVAQCAAVAVWVASAAGGVPWWVAVSAGVLTAALLSVRIRGRGVLDLAVILVRYRFPARREPGDLRDFPQSTGRPVGLRWDGTTVSTVVEVLPPPGIVTRIGRDGSDSEVTLPIAAIGACLRRHDVVLDGIDVIAHGRRVLDATPAGQVYSRLVGPLPAAATRTVWVVVRLDAAAAPDAVERRGGGADGAARTVLASTHRVVRTLGESGCAARILSSSEIRGAMGRVSHGADPFDARASWRHVQLPVGFNTGGGVDPRRIDAASLSRVWTVPSLSTTTVLRLRPGAGGSIRVGAHARFTSRTPDGPDLGGVRPHHGRHRDMFLASLPCGIGGLEDVTAQGSVPDLDELAFPVAGCGQLIGSDGSGRAVAARLTGPGVRSVYIAGELYLAQQIVFRAVAVGARVLVHTDRPDSWRPLLDGAAGPDRLRIAGEHPGDREFDTVVHDGIAPLPSESHATVVHVHTRPDTWPRDRPTVSIVQPNAAGDRIVLTARGRRTALTLVTIAAETAHIGRPRAVSDRVAAH
ncbi:type VII secretion protein EccE [Rhodococcus sp. (in: high G+C Gram-positive bacteria)]|uniref:type VII secretion protein EccE n=1 Tax=Rhodococcus sp. TaxID=1831 RepID=UPI002579E263|nr:type VII secretion protein EccE [Rhodococcus sp. (in: high G+C Gram-positive bacteria)]